MDPVLKYLKYFRRSRSIPRVGFCIAILRIVNLILYFSTGDIEYYCDYLLSFNDDATAIANFVYWAWGMGNCIDARYEGSVEYYLWGVDHFDASK